MRILLDTHIALWAIADTAKLSVEAIKLLELENNEIFYSVASVWEVAIKHKIKPENMPISEEEFVELCENLKLMTHDSLIPYYKESYVISI